MPNQTDNLRVCILTSQYFGWGKIGGFGSMSRTLAESLAARGIATSVIVPRRPGQQPHERLGNVNVLSFAPLDIREAARLLREIPADVFHSQDPQFLTALARWLRPDAKHVVTCRDPREFRDWCVEFRDATWSRRVRIPLNWFLEVGPLVRWGVRRADAVFTPAYFLREKAARIFKPRVAVGFMPNLIEAPDPLPPKNEKPALTFIGRLDRRKRPELFLDLARQFPEMTFIVVGKAESKQRDQQLRKTYASLPNVEWEGYIDRFKEPDRMRRILARTWALVNTASREGLPLTFQEAASYGCAIISEVDPDSFASRFGVHVADGNFGVAVSSFLQSPDAVRRKGAEARRYVLETYEATAATQKHIDSYCHVVKQRDKRA